MEIYIFNKRRELVGVVEAFEYLRWTRRYSACGSFEIKAVACIRVASLSGERTGALEREVKSVCLDSV